MIQSMDAVGSSADNAAAESLNAAFKRETLQGAGSNDPRSPTRTVSTRHRLRCPTSHNPVSNIRG